MTASEIRIERVEPDGDVVASVLDRYYAELDRRFPEGFDVAQTVAAPPAELRPPSGACLAALLGDDPVGCGVVRRLDGATAEIKRMWIHPVVRGRGVGRRLLAELETAARELGCRAVRLDTSAYLTEAITLYRTSGYLDIPAYNDNPYAAHWLEKSLL